MCWCACDVSGGGIICQVTNGGLGSFIRVVSPTSTSGWFMVNTRVFTKNQMWWGGISRGVSGGGSSVLCESVCVINLILLDEAKATRGLLKFIKAHDDALHFACAVEEVVDLCLGCEV